MPILFNKKLSTTLNLALKTFLWFSRTIAVNGTIAGYEVTKQRAFVNSGVDYSRRVQISMTKGRGYHAYHERIYVPVGLYAQYI